MSRKVLSVVAGVAVIGLMAFGGPLGVIGPILGMKIGVGALIATGVALADGEPLRRRRQLLGLGLPRVGMKPYRKRREWGRWGALRAQGDCMQPLLRGDAKQWLLIDHQADIRPGDLIAFATREHPRPFIKRFTTWTETGFECDTIHPLQTYEVRRDETLWCYRIRAVRRNALGMLRAAARVMRDPTRFDARLGEGFVGTLPTPQAPPADGSIWQPPARAQA